MPAVTAAATAARSPVVVNARAVTLGGRPAAAPWTTNRTLLNLPASARAAARSAGPDATTTLQPWTSRDPTYGSAAASVGGPVTAR